jgi:hypothetical protein
MEQACQTSFAIVNHIAGDLKTTPRVSLSEIWYKVTADVAAPIRAQVTRGIKGLQKAT